MVSQADQNKVKPIYVSKKVDLQTWDGLEKKYNNNTEDTKQTIGKLPFLSVS